MNFTEIKTLEENCDLNVEYLDIHVHTEQFVILAGLTEISSTLLPW